MKIALHAAIGDTYSTVLSYFLLLLSSHRIVAQTTVYMCQVSSIETNRPGTEIAVEVFRTLETFVNCHFISTLPGAYCRSKYFFPPLVKEKPMTLAGTVVVGAPAPCRTLVVAGVKVVCVEN